MAVERSPKLRHLATPLGVGGAEVTDGEVRRLRRERERLRERLSVDSHDGRPRPIPKKHFINTSWAVEHVACGCSTETIE